MTNTTKTTSRSHYAVYSPRGYANEITVQECNTAAEGFQSTAQHEAERNPVCASAYCAGCEFQSTAQHEAERNP